MTELVRSLENGSCFGFTEVDIEIPRGLWPKFEEMCQFFVNKEIPEGFQDAERAGSDLRAEQDKLPNGVHTEPTDYHHGRKK